MIDFSEYGEQSEQSSPAAIDFSQYEAKPQKIDFSAYTQPKPSPSIAELTRQASSQTGSAMPSTGAPPLPALTPVKTTGPTEAYKPKRQPDARFAAETAAQQEALLNPKNVPAMLGNMLYPGVGSIGSGTVKAATQPSHRVGGLLEAAGGLTEALQPLIGPAIAENPVGLVKGMAVGTGASYAAKKGAQAAGMTPEQQELAAQVGFFIPSIAGAVIRPRVAVASAPKGTAVGASAFGGRVRGGVKVSPEEVTLAGGIGSKSGRVSIPRGSAEDAGPTIEGQEANPKAQEAAARAGQVQRVDQVAARMARGMPPVEPEPPKPAAGPEQVTREHVDGIAQAIESLPKEQQGNALLEAHQNLAKWLVEHPRTISPFDGKIVMVKDEADAAKTAQEWINAGVVELTKAADNAAAEKTNKKTTAPQPNGSPSSPPVTSASSRKAAPTGSSARPSLADTSPAAGSRNPSLQPTPEDALEQARRRAPQAQPAEPAQNMVPPERRASTQLIADQQRRASDLGVGRETAKQELESRQMAAEQIPGRSQLPESEQQNLAQQDVEANHKQAAEQLSAIALDDPELQSLLQQASPETRELVTSALAQASHNKGESREPSSEASSSAARATETSTQDIRPAGGDQKAGEPPALAKGSRVQLPDGRSGTVTFLHPQLGAARVQTDDGKNVRTSPRELKPLEEFGEGDVDAAKGIEQLRDELESITAKARERELAASQEMRGLHPAEIDWMTKEELARRHEIELQLGQTKPSRAEAQERVEKKRAARQQPSGQSYEDWVAGGRKGLAPPQPIEEAKQEVAPGTATVSDLEKWKQRAAELKAQYPHVETPYGGAAPATARSEYRRLDSMIHDAEREVRDQTKWQTHETKPPDSVVLPDAKTNLRAHQKAYFLESLKPAMAAWEKMIGKDGFLHDQLIKGRQEPKDKPADFPNEFIHVEVPQDGKFLIKNTPYAVSRALKSGAQAFSRLTPQTFPNRNAVPRSPKEFDEAKYIDLLKAEIAGHEKEIASNPTGPRAVNATEQLKAAKENLAEASAAKELALDASLADYVQAARTAEGKIKLGADPKALGTILGPSLYAEASPKVITKELVQNAMDAVRLSKGAKRVTVDVDENQKLITVSDTGPGMTREELETVFTDLGSSGKREQAEASGGFGLAKAAPLMMSRRLEVTSVVREGGKIIEHSFAATPDQLLGEGVEINTRELPADTPTGTTVKAYTKGDSMYAAHEYLRGSSMSLNAPGELVALYNGEPAYWSYTEKPSIAKKPFATQSVQGARLSLYVSSKNEPLTRALGALSVEIHNNGIYQFTTYIRHAGGDLRGMPSRVAVDIHASVPEGDEKYPFLANRESLRRDASSAITKFVTDEIIAPAFDKQKAEISRLYHSMPVVQGTGIPIFDSGGRLTSEELGALRSDPAVRRLAENVARRVQQAIEAVRSSKYASAELKGLGDNVKRVGLVLSDRVHGVFISDPSDKSHATLFVNPFGGLTGTPWEDGSLVWHTIKHELVHDLVKGHNEAFTIALSKLEHALGKMQLSSMREMAEAYGDTDIHAGSNLLNPDLGRAIQIYGTSRAREESTPDIFGGEALHTEQQYGERRDAGDAGGLQRGRERAVPVQSKGQSSEPSERGQVISDLKAQGKSDEEVGAHLSELHRRSKAQSGAAIVGATNPIGFIYEAAKKLNTAYDGLIERGLQRVHLGRALPEVEREDKQLASLFREYRHAPAYFRAHAEAIAKQITGGLPRDQEKGFVLLADQASRDWLNENRHDEWQKYSDDPAIQKALTTYKPYEQEERDIRRARGDAIIDEDYLGRVYREHVAGVGEGKKNDAQYPKFDRVITPQMLNNKGRKASPEYYYRYGLHEFGPSFVTRYVATHLKLAEDAVATEFISKATKLAGGDELPTFIDYAGKRYYSPEAARLIRESGSDSELGKQIAADLSAQRPPDTEPIEQLPKPSEIREYSVYSPTQGGRLEAKARGLASSVIEGDVNASGKAYGLLHEMGIRYLGPKAVVEALQTNGGDAVPQFIRDMSAIMEPISGALRQNILVSGIPHIKNILRRVMLTHPTGQLSPSAWADAWKAALSKELKARGIKGVDDGAFDALLKHGGISPQGGIEYKHYLNLNFDPGAWKRLFDLFPALREAYGGESGLVKRGLVGTAKVAGEVISSPAHLANASMRKAIGRDWHDILFGPGGLDQKARLQFYDQCRRLRPGMTDEEIADGANDFFGHYARAGWTTLKRALAPFMLFPGWTFSSINFALRHPIRSVLPAALITLLLNYIVNRHNKSKQKFDAKRMHIGGRSVSDTLLNERLAQDNPPMQMTFDYTVARMRGKPSNQAVRDAFSGLSGDAGALIGHANPLLTMVPEVAANKRYMGGNEEIYKSHDFNQRGVVVPKAAGGKGTEDWMGYLFGKGVPQLDSTTGRSDTLSRVGRNVGTSNYPEKRPRF